MKLKKQRKTEHFFKKNTVEYTEYWDSYKDICILKVSEEERQRETAFVPLSPNSYAGV